MIVFDGICDQPHLFITRSASLGKSTEYFLAFIYYKFSIFPHPSMNHSYPCCSPPRQANNSYPPCQSGSPSYYQPQYAPTHAYCSPQQPAPMVYSTQPANAIYYTQPSSTCSYITIPLQTDIVVSRRKSCGFVTYVLRSFLVTFVIIVLINEIQ